MAKSGSDANSRHEKITNPCLAMQISGPLQIAGAARLWTPMRPRPSMPNRTTDRTLRDSMEMSARMSIAGAVRRDAPVKAGRGCCDAAGPEGATADEVASAMGWQRHSVHRLFSGTTYRKPTITPAADPTFEAEPFHVRLWPNNARRLSGSEFLAGNTYVLSIACNVLFSRRDHIVTNSEEVPDCRFLTGRHQMRVTLDQIGAAPAAIISQTQQVQVQRVVPGGPGWRPLCRTAADDGARAFSAAVAITTSCSRSTAEYGI
jgi:hypothetical protein